MTDRRSFLAGMVAVGLNPEPSWAEVGRPAYLTAGLSVDRGYVICGLSQTGQITFERQLPARGHAAAAHPNRPEAVAFARRPGTFAMVLDLLNGHEKASLAAPSGRHFCGHGVYSADGSQLFTTENDYDNARGLVGVWDTRQNYRRIGEWESSGIGPHDMKLLPDGVTLVVANGGIETHPETGRTKLNLATMRPNLSYLSPQGGLLDRVELGSRYRLNSIRHLAVGRDGSVAFAMQWQGDLASSPPLVGIHKQGTAARFGTAPAETLRRMVGYAGSIAISGQQNQVAITSPRGGLLQIYDLPQLNLKQQIEIEDVCGIAPGAKDFFATNGGG